MRWPVEFIPNPITQLSSLYPRTNPNKPIQTRMNTKLDQPAKVTRGMVTGHAVSHETTFGKKSVSSTDYRDGESQPLIPELELD
jgi:hypothetical protein